MTVYEFVTDLERSIDFAESRDYEMFEPVAFYAAPRRFWGSVSIRPRVIGRTPDGLTRYQFTLHQAKRMVNILRGRE
jgi:hypothetical protein